MRLMLDTNVLVKLCHPTGHRDVKEWFRELLARGDAAPEILISVLADYELRREMLAVDAVNGLEHLDELAGSLRSLPVTADVVRKAAELRLKLGTTRVPDADLLMAAQAELEGAIFVSGDKVLRAIPGVSVRDWNEISLDRE